MYVLDSVFDDELSFFSGCINVFQLVEQYLQFVGGQQADAFQHGDVGHGAQNIVFGQVKVHFAVTSYGETVDLFVYLNILFPKFLSHCCWFIRLTINKVSW